MDLVPEYSTVIVVAAITNEKVGIIMENIFKIIITIIVVSISGLFITAAFTMHDSNVLIINTLLAINLLAIQFCWIKAINNLSPEGKTQFWRIVIWSKLAAGRDVFTSCGWKYWILVRFLAALFAILMIVKIIFI
ncbi:MAG TPA: hypothetical protein DER40_09655 [Geobacter sp.]|nr:hypothetical protein [Geobacter sp.]